MKKQKKGFTLIELLIVIGIIAILAAIIYVAVDPAKRLGEARNAERWSSVNAILNGYMKFVVDRSGNEPVSLSAGTTYMIGTGGDSSGCGSASAMADLAIGDDPAPAGIGGLVDVYLANMPVDPNEETATTAKTYYWISKSASGRIAVGSCSEELSVDIEVSR